jgi:hypothetical protein
MLDDIVVALQPQLGDRSYDIPGDFEVLLNQDLVGRDLEGVDKHGVDEQCG